MTITLSTTSYLILGLVARQGSCTPYEIKQTVRRTINLFWCFPHSQLYAEPERLKKAGYLKETREKDGRKRRMFSTTPKGMEALQAWLREPSNEPTEIRDQGLLKLFLGELIGIDDVRLLARQQEQHHRQHLARYEELCAGREDAAENSAYPFAALEMGLLFEKAAVAFWATVAEQGVAMRHRLQSQWEEQRSVAQNQQDPTTEMRKEWSAEESGQRSRAVSTDLPDHLL